MDWAVFVAAGLATLAGALGVILSKNPVHAALMLVMTLFGVAVLFVAQAAHFLAAVQVIVYAGAIVVLFLFVIMLLGVDRSEDLGTEPLRGQRIAAALAGALGLVEVLLLARSHWVTGAPAVAGAASGEGSNVEKLARSLFTRYLLAFELTSVLLVIAVVGAVVLARRSRQDVDEATPVVSGDGKTDQGGNGDAAARTGGTSADEPAEGLGSSEQEEGAPQAHVAARGGVGGQRPPTA
ncbi:MAG TPA: NADH-quinone oxidoreductase subunit J [Acidimicrobiales bacterium]|nr:NADH-quinone oxidoreductase subunit J [Acidimicrobiales bacterium]